jgi:hypothetical protein
MRYFLALFPGVLALAAGCYGTSSDSDEGGGRSGSGGSGTAGSISSAGRGGRPAGGSGGSSSAGTSSGGSAGEPIVCEGDGSTIATIDKSCETSLDCVLVNHVVDCCGSILIMGINAAAVRTFQAAETQCTAGQPVCDCAPQGTNLEDGTWIGIGSTNYDVDCSALQCQSVYTGTTFACGEIQCTEEQYCTLLSGGPAGSETTASCAQRDDCASCDCLPQSVGCGCTQDDSGFITVSCAAP